MSRLFLTNSQSEKLFSYRNSEKIGCKWTQIDRIFLSKTQNTIPLSPCEIILGGMLFDLTNLYKFINS